MTTGAGWRRVVLAVVAGCLALAGCTTPAATVVPVGSASSGYGGALLTQPYELPDVQLTDAAGKPFALRSGASQPVLVLFFGYTNCPDICRTTLTDLASALNRVSPQTRAKVQVIFLTTDPERDTPAVMSSYLARFDPTFIGLTAPLAKLKAVGSSMGVVIEGTTPTANGGYEVAHSTQVIGFDAARKGRLVWTPGTTIGAFKDDFERFVAAQG
jgi:protein SCO1/2